MFALNRPGGAGRLWVAGCDLNFIWQSSLHQDMNLLHLSINTAHYMELELKLSHIFRQINLYLACEVVASAICYLIFHALSLFKKLPSEGRSKCRVTFLFKKALLQNDSRTVKTWEYSDSSECCKTYSKTWPVFCLSLNFTELRGERRLFLKQLSPRQAIASGDIKMSSDENTCNSINLIWIWNTKTIQGRQMLV